MSYRRRNECGHLVKVMTDPPPPVQAILQAYTQATGRPAPDSWRDALVELQRLAAVAVRIAVAAEQATRSAERWETL